jgi:hypothetical protein
MPSGNPAELDLRARFPKQLRQILALIRRDDRVGAAGENPDRQAVQSGHWIRDQRDHGSEQQRAAEHAWPEEQRRRRDIGAVG